MKKIFVVLLLVSCALPIAAMNAFANAISLNYSDFVDPINEGEEALSTHIKSLITGYLVRKEANADDHETSIEEITQKMMAALEVLHQASRLPEINFLASDDEQLTRKGMCGWYASIGAALGSGVTVENANELSPLAKYPMAFGDPRVHSHVRFKKFSLWLQKREESFFAGVIKRSLPQFDDHEGYPALTILAPDLVKFSSMEHRVFTDFASSVENIKNTIKHGHQVVMFFFGPTPHYVNVIDYREEFQTFIVMDLPTAKIHFLPAHDVEILMNAFHDGSDHWLAQLGQSLDVLDRVRRSVHLYTLCSCAPDTACLKCGLFEMKTLNGDEDRMGRFNIFVYGPGLRHE